MNEPLRIPGRESTPNCPVCGGETSLKQSLRAATHDVLVYRCRDCSVEYPVPKQRDGELASR